MSCSLAHENFEMRYIYISVYCSGNVVIECVHSLLSIHDTGFCSLTNEKPSQMHFVEGVLMLFQ